MTVFLGFGDRKLIYARSSKIFTHSVRDLGGRYEIFVRNMKVTVVFKHTCVNNRRNSLTVELVESALSSLKGLGYLYRTVASEVVEYNAVAIVYSSNGSAVLCDNEGREILVYNAKLGSVCKYCFSGRSKLSALAENVCLPAALYHGPICFVTVHSYLHTSAAGGYADIEIITSEVCNKCFKWLDIVKSACFTNVTSVYKNMDSYAGYVFSLCLNEHSLKMVDV